MVPHDFLLSPKFRTRLENMETTKFNGMQQLLWVLKIEYEMCCQQWKSHWNKWIQAEGA
jgi:hypothetical protein